MRNETYIFESPWIDADSTMPYRIVAYKRDSYPFPERAYVTHIEVGDPPRWVGSLRYGYQKGIVARYKIHGNYDLTHDQAVKDAMMRYEEKVGK